MSAEPQSGGRAHARLSDPARLAALAGTGLLEPVIRGALDDIAALARDVVGVPAALVSLVEQDRQCFVGAAGLGEPWATSRQTPLSHSFCQHVVVGDAALIIADARQHPLVRDNLAVRDLDVVAYAGIPLRDTAGNVLGALCAVDTQPRAWTATELRRLEHFARLAAREVASSAVARDLAVTVSETAALIDTALEAIVTADLEGRIVGWNRHAEELFGWSLPEVLGRPVDEVLIPARMRAARAGLARVAAGGKSELVGQRLRLPAQHRDGSELVVELSLTAVEGSQGLRLHGFLHDVTAEAAAADALAAERAFLRALLDSLDVGVLACDAQGAVTLSNQALREVSGIPATDPPALPSGLRHPDGTPMPAAQTPLARAHAGEHVRDLELLVQGSGRCGRAFLAHGQPITDAGGRTLGAVVAMHDITERRRAAHFAAVQAAVSAALADAASTADAGARVVEHVATALGWTLGELWLESDGELSCTARWSSPERDYRTFTPDELTFTPGGRGLPGRATVHGTLWVPDLGAESRFARCALARRLGLHVALAVPVCSASRTIGALTFFGESIEPPDPALIAVIEEVAAQLGRYLERRRAEELALQLAAARRDFDRVIAQIREYVFTVEVLPDGRVASVFASPDGREIFGGRLAADQDLVAALVRMLHPEDAGGLRRWHEQVTAGRYCEVEFRLVGLDGVTRWVWTRGQPRREGQRLFVDGMLTNISDRKEHERRREQLLAQEQAQVEELRRLDRLKDEFVALGTHELRNPITSIRGYAELLLDDPEPLPESQRRMVATIDRSAQRLVHIVDDLLDLARFDSGDVHLERRPLDLLPLVREALEGVSPAAEAKSLRVTLQAPASASVDGDPLRLRQVLDNLLSNAVKYTPAHGQVDVVVGADPVEGICVTVADTGIGIPEQECDRLFERFFRASTARQNKIAGTGLGLAITRTIVEQHGGTAVATPRRGGGTSFTVLLPASWPLPPLGLCRSRGAPYSPEAVGQGAGSGDRAGRTSWVAGGARAGGRDAGRGLVHVRSRSEHDSATAARGHPGRRALRGGRLRARAVVRRGGTARRSPPGRGSRDERGGLRRLRAVRRDRHPQRGRRSGPGRRGGRTGPQPFPADGVRGRAVPAGRSAAPGGRGAGRRRLLLGHGLARRRHLRPLLPVWAHGGAVRPVGARHRRRRADPVAGRDCARARRGLSRLLPRGAGRRGARPPQGGCRARCGAARAGAAPARPDRRTRPARQHGRARRAGGLAVSPARVWLVIALCAAVTFAIKGLGPAAMGSRQLPPRLARVVGLLAAALLSALVVTSALADGQRLHVGADTAGVAVAGLLLLRRVPVLPVVVAAAAVTALLRRAGVD